MTDAEFVKFWEYFTSYRADGCREGQSLMNALSFVQPDIYEMIWDTDADCYYDDEKVPAFYRAIGWV